MKKYLIILFATLFLPNYSLAKDEGRRIITVSGQASQDFAPDIASFSVNIIGKALDKNSAKTNHDNLLKSLIELTKRYDIDPKDLKTGFSSITPTYEYTNNKRKFTGYVAQTNINIIIRDLTQTGQFQEELVSSGFDNFQGPAYNLDKIYTYNEKILEKAVANAKEKAIKIAVELGEKIDKAVDVREENSAPYNPRPVYAAKAMLMSASPEDAVSPPAGVVTINSTVVATFSMQ